MMRFAKKHATRPLLSIGEYLWVARGRGIYICRHDFSDLQYLCTLPGTRLINLLSQFRLLRRLLRLEPTIAVPIDADTVLMSSGAMIWRLHASSKQLVEEHVIPHGRKALNIRRVVGLEGIADGFYFGEYFENKPKSEVAVWFRPLAGGAWRVVYQFAANEIEHIHDIVADPYRQCLWVLTGDFDQGCGLWQVTHDFVHVQAVLRGSQQYRAAWLAPLRDHLVYATDTPLEQNYLYALGQQNGAWGITMLHPLPASSIYATMRGETIYFSTTIEPGLLTGNRIRDVLATTIGSGINDSYARLYRFDSQHGLEELLRAKKDFYPMRLLQYGTFHLCDAMSETGPVYAYGCAVTGLDGCAITVA